MQLLDALREHLGLTGTEKGCGQGQRGACTVLVDVRRVLSCFCRAAAVTGDVTTIEGLAGETEPLHPMQQAFLDGDAYPCGYCTPGQILSAIGCVSEGRAGARRGTRLMRPTHYERAADTGAALGLAQRLAGQAADGAVYSHAGVRADRGWPEAADPLSSKSGIEADVQLAPRSRGRDRPRSRFG